MSPIRFDHTQFSPNLDSADARLTVQAAQGCVIYAP